jgi:glycosyltransferase involved in cell wall biosynthesis
LAEVIPPAGGSEPRPGILVYGMYDLARLDRAPTVRISLMIRALDRHVHTESITGGRGGRFVTAVRWLMAGGPRRVQAVYVELPTSSVMPTDLLFLAIMRLSGRPVGMFFRDAYQLFRDVHPRTRRRQVLSDLLWRLSLPVVKRLATVRYAPSLGLVRALGLSDAVLLPPGTDPTLPDLGIGEPDFVATIAQVTPRSGLGVLVEAMGIVRTRRPAARLRVIAGAVDRQMAAALPSWVEVVSANRESMAELLRPGRVCVLPLPVNAYTNLAVAVRLLDLLGFGKPIVATDTHESRLLIEASGAGIVTPDTASGLADGILPILDDDRRAALLASNARAYACSSGSTWDARARTVLDTLRVAESSLPDGE